jgi:hypothetical protein
MDAFPITFHPLPSTVSTYALALDVGGTFYQLPSLVDMGMLTEDF